MEVKTKRKPKPLILSPPPSILTFREPIPAARPLGELDALSANFQYLQDRVSDVTLNNDLPHNAHEFLTRTQQAINNLSSYTRKIKDRDLKEYREALANHQIELVSKIAFAGVRTVFLCGLVSSCQQETYVQSNQKSNQSSVPFWSADGIKHYAP
jgi:hypothetical protein